MYDFTSGCQGDASDPWHQLVPPQGATVPKHVGPDHMDLTVANTNTRFYCCNGFGHEACDCATPHTWRHGQASRSRMGGNLNRWDSRNVCPDIRRGGTATSARPAAGGINTVQAAAVEDVSRNYDAEDSAVEQVVGG
jgi:hypothetical protein